MKYVLYPIHEYVVELPIEFDSYIDAVTYGMRVYGAENFVVYKDNEELAYSM